MHSSASWGLQSVLFLGIGCVLLLSAGIVFALPAFYDLCTGFNVHCILISTWILLVKERCRPCAFSLAPFCSGVVLRTDLLPELAHSFWSLRRDLVLNFDPFSLHCLAPHSFGSNLRGPYPEGLAARVALLRGGGTFWRAAYPWREFGGLSFLIFCS